MYYSNNNQEVETRKSSHDMSEKIQVQVDSTTNTLKFGNKSALEKIVEYVNLDSSNKYTLVLTYAGSHSKPQSHQPPASLGRSHAKEQQQHQARSKSPPSKKSATSGHSSTNVASRKFSERKKSIKHGDEITGTNNEILDNVLTKVVLVRRSMFHILVFVI